MSKAFTLTIELDGTEDFLAVARTLKVVAYDFSQRWQDDQDQGVPSAGECSNSDDKVFATWEVR